MQKHGNTLVPGQPVKKTGTEGKTAESAGEVTDASPDQNLFEVKWADGTRTWEPPEDLEKA